MTRQSLVALAALVLAQACAPKTPPASSVPVSGPPAPTLLECPDSSDTPQIIEYSVQTAYRAFKRNPTIAIPSCYVELAGRHVKSFADSATVMALEMSDSISARRPNDVANLA